MMSGGAEPIDLCVAGSGPAGMAVAIAAARRGLKVVLLEAGGERPGRRTGAGADIITPRRHAPLELATCQAKGGTSWLWAGRCVPFDAIDFEPRPWTEPQAWPIAASDVEPWIAPSTEFLGCGAPVFSKEADALPGLPGIDSRWLERWSAEPRMARIHGPALDHPNLRVLTHHRVSNLVVGEGRMEGFEVRGPAGQEVIAAERYVLACGGVETTRLLLQAQRRQSRLFGGEGGPLGRFYQGHLFGKISQIAFASAAEARLFDFTFEDGSYARRHLTLPRDRLVAEGLSNIAFWRVNPRFHDPRHGNGALSAVYLALLAPVIGRRLMPEALRLAQLGEGRPDLAAHLRNIALSPGRTAREIACLLRRRLLARPRQPGFLAHSADHTYPLQYHAEHRPRADSRIWLDDAAPGGLRIDLRFSEDDARSVLKAHELLDRDLRASGRNALSYLCPEPERIAAILDQASDGFHQIGTTRMGADPRASVVDADCRSHDLHNLFVASSSVFPTSGKANPTLMIVALALRLADHLARKRNL